MDEIDRLLSSEERLEPSSGFAAAAMAAVREAATEPPPLPFPWGRLVSGLVVCCGLTLSGAALAMSADLSAATLPVPLPQLATVAPELGLAGATILASFGLLRLLRQLVTRVPSDALTR